MSDYAGEIHFKGTEADPQCNSDLACRDDLCICFPPEWMNNKSFILLPGWDNSGRCTVAIKELRAWQRMHIWLVSNIQRAGGGVLCNSVSLLSCARKTVTFDTVAAACRRGTKTDSVWCCTVRTEIQRLRWPFLWHGEPVLVLLALLSILLHGGAGVGDKSLLHGLSNPQTEELVGAGLLPLHGTCTMGREMSFKTKEMKKKNII